MKILISVYSHPEFYPPTLNAVRMLSKLFDGITIVSRNVLDSDWNYPAQVKLVTSGEKISIRESEVQPFFKKILAFFLFLATLRNAIKNEKPEWVLVYNEIPLFALKIIRFTGIKSFKVWYHNHDPMELQELKRTSVSYWSKRTEAGSFGWINLFTLPANERTKYFNLENFRGHYFYLPNLPSLEFYADVYSEKLPDGNSVKILYQGFINETKGIEEIITLIKANMPELSVYLTLLGTIRPDYKQSLSEKIRSEGVEHNVIFHPFISYKNLPFQTNTHHIGLAVYHSRTDAVGSTVGTASNKIYEYAACGLPVIVYDNIHFREHLGKYPWIFFTDLTTESLNTVIRDIISNYGSLSISARESFVTELNYEKYFNLVIEENIKKK